MKKKRSIILSITAVLALSAFKIADNIITRLGMQEQSAKAYILNNVVGRFSSGPMDGPIDGNPTSVYSQLQSFQIPTARLLPNIITGDKAGAAKELCEYVKEYVSSEAFITEYNKLREDAMPLTDKGSTLASLGRDKEVIQKNINNYKTDLKYVAEQEKLLGETQARIDMLTEAAKKPFPGKEMWEKAYPADPSSLIKKRLQEYLTVAATVDFSAKLTGSGKKQTFVNPAYEKKSLKWKAIYRAGKEVNDVVTPFVKEWLKMPAAPATKEKTTPAAKTQSPAPVAKTTTNKAVASKTAAATAAPAQNKYDLISRSTDDKIVGTFYESWDPSIDKALFEEARYVVFVSQVKGLCGSTGKYRQIYWRDRKTGETRMVSSAANGEEGNGSSFAPVNSVSPYYVVFESYATNLVGNDNNGARDVFLWRRTPAGGEIERVSVGPGGEEGNSESFEPAMSGMAQEVVFSSNASNLVPGTEVSGVNVYLYKRHTKTIELVSKDYKTGKGVGGSRPSIDMNGYNIAFYSFAYTLVPDDNNNLWDIFLFSKNTSFVAQPLRRITMAYGGGERNQGTESSSRVVTPTISGNGRFITYATTATNVVPDDNNNAQDVFVYDAETNTTVRASVSNDGTEGDADSPAGQGERIDISENGSKVVFTTLATNFGVPARNVVLYDLPAKRMVPVSSITGSWVATPSISRRGEVVVFGCGLPLDKRFNSSGLFAATVALPNQ